MQFIDVVPVPQTAQELDQAIQSYRISNWQGQELFQHWQAIRLAALAQATCETPQDAGLGEVPGDDSY